MKRRLVDLSRWTDDQLQAGWNHGFECRVKSGRNKGCITLRQALLGSAILAEADRRGLRINTPTEYQ